MTMRLGLIIAACLCALAATIPATRAQSVADTAATAERARIKEIVREILKENPELMLDAIQSLEAREREEAATKSARVLGEQRSRLERDAGDPVGGNAKGDVTLVAFLDYKCPYCKQVSDQLFKAVEGDGKVRLVFKELP